LTAVHVFFLSKNIFINRSRVGFKIRSWRWISSAYPVILLRFVGNKQSIIWVGIKIFTCGVLYLIARNNTLNSSDLRLLFLFFSAGILANGILVNRVRQFEGMYLSFYMGLPISLLKRLLQYSIVYFVLLFPEFGTVLILAPLHLSYNDALQFSLCGYSLLLLMNSITFLQHFSTKEYLPILLLILCVQYIFLMTAGLFFLILIFLGFAVMLFLIGYYKREWSTG
jgi:hypothetical protein